MTYRTKAKSFLHNRCGIEKLLLMYRIVLINIPIESVHWFEQASFQGAHYMVIMLEVETRL